MIKEEEKHEIIHHPLEIAPERKSTCQLAELTPQELAENPELAFHRVKVDWLDVEYRANPISDRSPKLCSVGVSNRARTRPATLA